MKFNSGGWGELMADSTALKTPLQPRSRMRIPGRDSNGEQRGPGSQCEQRGPGSHHVGREDQGHTVWAEWTALRDQRMRCASLFPGAGKWAKHETATPPSALGGGKPEEWSQRWWFCLWHASFEKFLAHSGRNVHLACHSFTIGGNS